MKAEIRVWTNESSLCPRGKHFLCDFVGVELKRNNVDLATSKIVNLRSTVRLCLNSSIKFYHGMTLEQMCVVHHNSRELEGFCFEV